MLFKTSADVLQHCRLSQVKFEAIKPTIATAENKYLVPLLGIEQYNALNDAYQAAPDVALTPALEILLEYCRRVTGPYTCVSWAPKADLQLSDSGAQRLESETNKSAFQYQIKNYVEANQLEGDEAAEALLQFLDANKNNYPLWVAGNGNKIYRELFIKSGGEFQQLFTTAAPYSNYWQLRSFIKDVEESTLRNFLGENIFATLKAKNTTAIAFTTLEEELMFCIKKALAALAVAKGFPFVNVRMDGSGLTQAGGIGGNNDATRSRNLASDNALSAFVRNAETIGNQWLKNTEAFLIRNATDFPLWRTEAKREFEPLKSSFGLI